MSYIKLEKPIVMIEKNFVLKPILLRSNNFNNKFINKTFRSPQKAQKIEEDEYDQGTFLFDLEQLSYVDYEFDDEPPQENQSKKVIIANSLQNNINGIR